MKKEECFFLGKIVKKYSFKGELILRLDTDEPEIYENLNAIFIDMGKDLVPFFIENKVIQKGNHFRIRLEDIDSEREAESLLKKEVYLPLDMLPKLSDDQFYYHQVIGYQLNDENIGKIGQIESINDATAQALFVVKNENQEILIPMVDDFILKIDHQKKTVFVKTPEGLIDLNP